MDIQSTLTLAIEVVFWVFVSLMIFDFINRLFVLDTNTTTTISFTRDNLKSHTPAALSVIAPQFEQLTDPWKLTLEPQYTTIETQSFVLPFPTLRLLPPVKEVQQKLKRTKTTKKATTKAKATSTKTKQLPRRPRKQTA